MTSAARQDAIRRFSDIDSVVVFLVRPLHVNTNKFSRLSVRIYPPSDVVTMLFDQVSLKAGGTGLNLVMASRVFLMDPWSAVTIVHKTHTQTHINIHTRAYTHTLTHTHTHTHIHTVTHRWNPAIEQQCIDRVHRMGQTRPVEVVRLLVRDTAEQEIARLQERKRSVAASVLDKKALASTTKLSAQELAQCFGLRSH
jgi:SNF2 family DNA or RNA helicase